MCQKISHIIVEMHYLHQIVEVGNYKKIPL